MDDEFDLKEENYFAHDFTNQLHTIKSKFDDITFAQNVYSSLCNRTWELVTDPSIQYSCSWRFAGGLVAGIRDCGEDYLDFYCSGIHDYTESNNNGFVPEGFITTEIIKTYFDFGWVPQDEPKYIMIHNDKICCIINKILFIQNEQPIKEMPQIIEHIKQHFPENIRANFVKWVFDNVI